MEKLNQLELTNCLGGINFAMRVLTNCVINVMSYLLKVMIGRVRR